MLLFEDCIHDILTCFAVSDQAAITLASVVEDDRLKQKYSEEQVKFHVQHLVDEGWLRTDVDDARPFKLVKMPSGSYLKWSDLNWRWTKPAFEFWQDVTDSRDVQTLLAEQYEQAPA